MMQYSGTPNPAAVRGDHRHVPYVSQTRNGFEAPETTQSLFAGRPEKEGKIHELKDEEIGAIDGIVLKK